MRNWIPGQSKKLEDNQNYQNHNQLKHQGYHMNNQRNQGLNNIYPSTNQDGILYPINNQRSFSNNSDKTNSTRNSQKRQNINMNSKDKNESKNISNKFINLQIKNNNNDNPTNNFQSNQNLTNNDYTNNNLNRWKDGHSNNNFIQRKNNSVTRQRWSKDRNKQSQNNNYHLQQRGNYQTNQPFSSIQNSESSTCNDSNQQFIKNNNNQHGRNHHDNQHNRNQQKRNHLPTQIHPHQIGDIKKGKYIVDEFGDYFLQEEVDGELVKERIYIEKDIQNRAIHNSTVQFSLIQKNNNNGNKQKRAKAQILSVSQYPDNLNSIVGFFGPKSNNSKKPEIDFDIKFRNISYGIDQEFYFYPLQLIYPKMILRLENAEEKYPNGELFKRYFKVKFLEWPVELTNDGPLCDIIESQGYLYDEVSDCEALLNTLNINTNISPEEKKCIEKVLQTYNNQVNKKREYINYKTLKVFTVDQQNTMAFDDAFSFEQISEQVLEQQKNLAKVEEINKKINEEKKSQEIVHKCSKKGEKTHKIDINQSQNKKIYGLQQIFMKDVEESAFEDLKTKQKNDKMEEEKSYQDKEQHQNHDFQDFSQNDGGEHHIENYTSIEQVQDITEEDIISEMFEKKLNIDESLQKEKQQREEIRKLYRLGIHISDLSRCIEAESELYKGLEKRGQSIYLKLGQNKSFVKHMLDSVLVEQFSLKKGQTRLTKSLFICIEQDKLGQFIFHWDTFRIVDTKIISQENYYYNEFDGFCKNLNEIRGLYKSDSSQNNNSFGFNIDRSEDTCQSDEIINQKKLVINQNELQTLFQLGGYLYQQREQKGQKAFQEEAIGIDKERSISSLMVEEFMILYNQCISRKLVVQQHICQGKKEIDQNMKEQNKKADNDIKEIYRSIKIFEQQIKGAEKLQYQDQGKLNKLLNSIKSANSQLQRNEILLERYQKSIGKENQNILKLQELQQKSQNDQYSEDSLTDSTELTSESDSVKNNEMEFESQLSEKQDNCEIYYQNQFQKISDKEEQQSKYSKSEQNEESQIVNPYSLRKNFYLIQLKQCQDRIQKLEQDCNEEFNVRVLEQNKRKKNGFLKQIQYFEVQCKQVGFNELKYEKLEEFQNSMRQLQSDKNIEPIIRAYLLFQKRKILQDLNRYFAVCDREKKQIQEHENTIKQKRQQITKINGEISQINYTIDDLTQKENQFDQQQEQQKQLVEEVIEIKEEDDDEQPQDEVDDMEEQCQAKFKQQSPIENKINTFTKNILLSEQSIKRFEKLIFQNKQKTVTLIQDLERCNIQRLKLEESISQSKINIQSIADQKQELNMQIQQIKNDLKKQEKELINNLTQEVNDLHDYFEIIPESEKYVTLTSPIRKFNDIIVQQFLNLSNHLSNNFESEYINLIRHKQKNTKSRNEIRKFQEKAEKLKTCRNILQQSENEYKLQKLISHEEQVLLIKNVTFNQMNKMQIFLGNEMQITKFFSPVQQISFKDMTVWQGHVAAKRYLPYDFDLLLIENEQGVFEKANQ